MNLIQAQRFQDILKNYPGVRTIRTHDGPRGYSVAALHNGEAYGTPVRDPAQEGGVYRWLSKRGVRPARPAAEVPE